MLDIAFSILVFVSTFLFYLKYGDRINGHCKGSLMVDTVPFLPSLS